jgi:F-box interacting protein
LWNPSIRKFKSFRLMPWLTRPHNRFAVGIAYDSRNDDHKIVRMVSFQGFIGVIALPAVAEVYTLSTDSWRRIMISVDSLSGYIDDIDESPCVFFNGALHCLAKVGDYKFILSFDINDESFREIMLPGNYLNRSDRHFFSLFLLNT